MSAWRIFVARRLDRSRAHPAPDQNHVLVRGIVEAVPDAARRIDHVAFDRGLKTLVGDDMALALQHDEELVAVFVQMLLVACARLEYGPADHVVGAGRFLVDQELHLHVDPAVLALQPLNLRHVLDVGAVHRGSELGGCDSGCRLHGLGQRRADHLSLACHDCPPSRRYTSCATTKSLPSMPSPRQAVIISLAAAASGVGLPSWRARLSANSISFCCSVTSASGTCGILPSRMNGPR